MQTLNLHAVESIKITSMQEYKNSKWKKITITLSEGEFEIILFPNAADIPVAFEFITLSEESPNV